MKNLLGLCLLVLFMISPFVLKAGNGQIMFVAKLNTDNEIPVVRGDALGMVTFLLSEDRKNIFIHGVFTNLSGSVIGCHIHLGKKEENGPVLIDLTSFVSGDRIKAELPLPDGLLALAESGQLYINVHTVSHSGGEMRGQLKLMAEIIVPFLASGAEQVPPDSIQAYAFGTLRFSQNLTRMQYEILPVGLSGPVTGAHIHNAPVGVNGPVIVGLNTGEFITGTIEDTTLVKLVYNQLLVDSAYVNIHTTANPNGEIRAQLYSYLINSGTAILNGDQETPAVTSSAKGYGYATINTTFDSIYYGLIYNGITPTAAHIHQAAAGIGGAVIFGLNSFLPVMFAGREPISNDQLSSFFKDELYFNIHTTANPNGEIRGQIENNLMNSFAFDLCGDQENPKKNVKGYGAAYIAINKANTEMDYGIITDSINGDITSTRLYDAAFGSVGPTLLNLNLPNQYISNVIPITGTLASKINADHVYLNNHTAANPSGEIRGQVRRILSCVINTSNQETEIKNISLIQNLSVQTFALQTEFDRNITAQVVITDLTGESILQWNTIVPAGFNKLIYNITALSSGFYLLNVMTNKKIIKTFKLIKL